MLKSCSHDPSLCSQIQIQIQMQSFRRRRRSLARILAHARGRTYGMSKNGDREAGRKKLDEFRAAKAAKAAAVNESGDMQSEKSAVPGANDEVATMRQKLLKAVKKGKSIEAERDALAKRVEEMEAERKRLEDALGERAAERTSTANAEQEKELASLKEQLERNSEALEYAKGEAHQAAEEARDQAHKAEKELATLREALREATAAKEAAERSAGEIQSLKAAAKEAKDAKEAAEREVETYKRSAQQTASGAESRVVELSAELDAKSTKLQNLEAELLSMSSASEEEKAALAAENVRLSNKIDEGRLALEEMEKEKEMYVTECERALQVNEESQRLSEQLKQRLSESEAKLETTTAEISALREKTESNAAVEDAERRASEALNALSQAQGELRSLKDSSDATVKDLRAKVSNLETALQTQRTAAAAAPVNSGVSNEEVMTLRQQLNSAQKQIEQLQSLLSDARADKASSGFTNKKNEDFAETDIEGAVLTGGSYAFVPLQGHLKSATNIPALQHPAALEIASNFDRASVYLQRRPFVRLALSVYIFILHLMVLF